jgi:hypothetical protein
MSLLLALPQLETDLEQLLLDLSKENDPAAARKAYAKRQARAFYDFMLQGLVQTAGTAASQTGKIT